MSQFDLNIAICASRIFVFNIGDVVTADILNQRLKIKIEGKEYKSDKTFLCLWQGRKLIIAGIDSVRSQAEHNKQRLC